MLINLTNHPYDGWSEQQKAAAAVYGECVDVPFPNVSPEADEKDVDTLADDYLKRIRSLGKKEEITVHLMGEQSFCFSLINKLLHDGIQVIASTTLRDVKLLADGSKQVVFRFVRFRNYR